MGYEEMRSSREERFTIRGVHEIGCSGEEGVQEMESSRDGELST